MNWYEDMGLQFLAGIATSLADRKFSRNSDKHKSERVDRKLEHAKALAYLVENEQTEQPEYFQAILKAREYFREHGQSVKSSDEEKGSLLERLTEKGTNLLYNERLNNLPLTKTVGAAFGIEFLYDLGVIASQLTLGAGNGLASLGASLYQGPALAAGLLTGRAALYVKDLFTKGSEEKLLDEKLKLMTKDGKLLSLVREYSRTTNLKERSASESTSKPTEETPKQPMTAEGIGQTVGKTAANAVQGLGSLFKGIGDAISQRSEDGKKADDEAREATKEKLRKDYDQY